MKRIYLSLIMLIFSSSVFSQSLTQAVRGTVVDADSKFPLMGASVIIGLQEVTTANDGSFKINNIPIGRSSISVSLFGYKGQTRSLELNSAKEVVVNIPLVESSTQLGTVDIVAVQSGQAKNEMATVSSRQFSVEETNLYAGSRGEPARMATNFAGVQGSDDQRNDLVIRGNTPAGVLYRMDGINIPNPNHFSIPGTGGGPVTILNNKFLANSDFFTGAWPAEYGNAIAGVFDLEMRDGNNEKFEGSAQLGLLGTELMLEGPLGAGIPFELAVNIYYDCARLKELPKRFFGTGYLADAMTTGDGGVDGVSLDRRTVVQSKDWPKSTVDRKEAAYFCLVKRKMLEDGSANDETKFLFVVSHDTKVASGALLVLDQDSIELKRMPKGFVQTIVDGAASSMMRRIKRSAVLPDEWKDCELLKENFKQMWLRNAMKEKPPEPKRNYAREILDFVTREDRLPKARKNDATEKNLAQNMRSLIKRAKEKNYDCPDVWENCKLLKDKFEDAVSQGSIVDGAASIKKKKKEAEATAATGDKKKKKQVSIKAVVDQHLSEGEVGRELLEGEDAVAAAYDLERGLRCTDLRSQEEINNRMAKRLKNV